MATFSPRRFFKAGLAALALLGSGWSQLRGVEATGASQEIAETIPMRGHSLYPPYVDDGLQSRWFDFGADTVVNTNSWIRLTQDKPSQMGWLWSRMPIAAENFQIDVEFKIDGKAHSLYGDGMAIWLTKDRTQPGPVFGSKDNFDGLGIFIDTYPNSRHSYHFPYIMGMIGDGRTSYDLGNDGDGQAAGSCSMDVRRTGDVPTKMRILYSKGRFLDVKIHYREWDNFEPCFRIENYTLPLYPYIGFTALTGDVSDAHDIISVATSSVVWHASSVGGPGTYKDHSRATASWGIYSLFSTLLKLVFALVVVALAVVGYKTFVGGRRQKRF